MKTAVVMLHYGEVKTTRQSLKKLAPKLKQHDFILVNNTSNDLTSFKKIIPQIQLINNSQNLGFAKGVNQGIQLAFKNKQVDSVLLLNNDLHFSFGNIDLLRKTLFQQSNHGIVSPVLHHHQVYDWGGKYNPWFANVKHQNFPQKPKRVIKVDHVAGAAMLIRRSLINKIGLFDERFFLYFEDLDFCLRAKQAGFLTLIDPEVVAEHQVSQASQPLQRTFHQWKSHLKFIFKYLPLKAYPTSLIYDLIFSLVLGKLFIQKLLK